MFGDHLIAVRAGGISGRDSSVAIGGCGRDLREGGGRPAALRVRDARRVTADHG